MGTADQVVRAALGAGVAVGFVLASPSFGVGFEGLGDLPGGVFSSRTAHANGDGSIVVGQGSTALGYEAFIWDGVNGMRNLRSVLVNRWGLDLTGWQLIDASGISSDGSVICGTGINPDGYMEAWVAVIPEPASLLTLLLGGLGLIRRRRTA
ncbi:MAG: PEP-CTERM sorting domain-containing protein [Phycisphaerae bacterium]|nr:PEP-CTERM sorting domain-containing protein [Phycisphaerae bacterium]